MRDPERIKELLGLLEVIWQRSPDLRFNQLLYNLQSDFSQQNNGAGQVKEVADDGFTKTGFDFFYLKDSDFIEFLSDLASSE
jgi:uncharacterized protein YihD (DUF1040 family)